MAKRGIYIESTGLDAAIASLREFVDTLPEVAEAECSRALDATAELSRSLVHVSKDKRHAGTLRASERHSGDIYGGISATYSGAISYGESGVALKDDHRSGYLWELQRGGDHSQFIDSLAESTAPAWEEALNNVFDATLGTS